MNENQAYANLILKEQFQQVGAALHYDSAVSWLIGMIKELPRKQTLVLSLVGGAASGKSTLVRSLISGLSAIDMTADVIATDDFNKGDRGWRKENYDDKAALPDINPREIDPLILKDFDLLNHKINEIRAIVSPETVAVPTYNPLTGLAIDEGEENYIHHIGPIDILFVEGDFHSVSKPDLVIFVHLIDTLRLQNRINRDVVSRDSEVTKITDSFHFRQQYQHTPLTLPIIERADIVLDISIIESAWHYDVYTKRSLERI